MSSVNRTFSYLRYKFFQEAHKKMCNLSFKGGKRTFASLNHDLPSVSVSDMRRNLRLHGFSVEDGFTCLLTKCPICKSLGNTNLGEAYINKVTGL